ncbi:MAG TPA: hypothetical protein VIM48_07360 [Chthoniobacterales bacterium]
MKLATKFAAILGSATLLSSSALFAGDGKSFKEVQTTAPAATPFWTASLSAEWDSLYMFRGVNQLPNTANGYGSSIFDDTLSITFNLSPNDFLTIGDWIAFGLTNSNYKENDVLATYTHTFGNLSVHLGYTLYALLSVNDTGVYSNELNTGVAYKFTFGSITVTPAINYFFNVGPNIGNGGYVEQCASYLEARVDSSIPVLDPISAAPYVSFGTSFRYNYATNTNPPSPLTGTNNIQTGVSLPIAVNKTITISPYVAYSYQWYGLVNTTPSTWWGGGSVTFTF